MYIPSAFQVDDQTALHEFMRQHSFATLVSAGDEEPLVSHLPLLLEADSGTHGKLVGHMARLNEHWRIGADRPTVAIFHGPHAYISPTWYGEPGFVPTWNYITVHAHGTLLIRDERERLRENVTRLVDIYEEGQSPPWNADAIEPEFMDQLLDGIVGFELPIERIDGKWKLGQNHTIERRERAVESLRDSGSPDEVAVAEAMAATLIED